MTLPRTAAAQGSNFVFGGSTCPSAEQVETEVLQLAPQAASAQLRQDLRVELTDTGAELQIRVDHAGGTTAKTYEDHARDCAKRARFTAAFVVLTLFPPEIGAPPEPPPEPERAKPVPQRPPKTRPVPPEPQGGAVRCALELMAMGEAAPPSPDAPSVAALGAELGANCGKGSLRVVASATVLGRQEFTLTELRGSVEPWRFGLGARWHLPLLSGLRFAADLEARLALDRLSGESARQNQSSRPPVLGLRGGMRFGYDLGRRMGLVGGLTATLFPDPPDLVLIPTGKLGRAPPLWLGAMLGVSILL